MDIDAIMREQGITINDLLTGRRLVLEEVAMRRSMVTPDKEEEARRLEKSRLNAERSRAIKMNKAKAMKSQNITTHTEYTDSRVIVTKSAQTTIDGDEVAALMDYASPLDTHSDNRDGRATDGLPMSSSPSRRRPLDMKQNDPSSPLKKRSNAATAIKRKLPRGVGKSRVRNANDIVDGQF
jgi:hypothetical protein